MWFLGEERVVTVDSGMTRREGENDSLPIGVELTSARSRQAGVACMGDAVCDADGSCTPTAGWFDDGACSPTLRSSAEAALGGPLDGMCSPTVGRMLDNFDDWDAVASVPPAGEPGGMATRIEPSRDTGGLR